MKIESLSKLSFFKVGRYEYKTEHICDFSNIPRPHFCVGLLIEGTAEFESEGETIFIAPGDIIFVPITSRYISRWAGHPNVLYISMHFAFEPQCGISENSHFALQKVSLPNFDKMIERFNFSKENYNGEEAAQMETLSIFYDVLGQLLPKLNHTNNKNFDKRIELATEYINLNSEQEISVNDLAAISGMSVPSFYTQFKKSTGTTPIEYKNRISIGRAMRLLKSDKSISIEEISEMLGFESSTYFRRVFKKFTGVSPREYRFSKIEM